MEKFIETGKKLKSKQLSQPLISNDEHDVMEFSDIEPGNKVDKVIREVNAQVKGVLLQYDLDYGKFVGDPEYKCEICQSLFESKGNLLNHRKNKHEGVRYPCDSCDYKATKKSNLKQHKQNIHKGVRYTCDNCDYNATTTGNLKKHKDFMHKGIRYSCDWCDYTTTRKDHLKLHKDSIHEGVRYFCDT